MSSIDNYLQAIQTAIYGSEVRSAIHDSIQLCHEENLKNDSTLSDVTPNIVSLKNIFDMSELLEADSWTHNNEDYYGPVKKLYEKYQYTLGAGGLPIYGNYKANTQYTISMYVCIDQAAENNGLQVLFYYLDGTSGGGFTVANSQTEWVLRTATSAANKTLAAIVVGYSSGGNNIWHIKQLQIEEGSSFTGYVSYGLTAQDKVARRFSYVTPQDCGAVGDGITDDSDAIQKAFSFGYPVYFPSSHNERYLVTKTIKIKNTSCKLAYADTVTDSAKSILIFDITSRDDLTWDDKENYPLFEIECVQMFHFVGISATSISMYEDSMRLGVFLKALKDTTDNDENFSDYDIRIDNCFLRSFYRTFLFRGRGFEVLNSTIASCDYVGTFSWSVESGTTHPAKYGQRALTFKNNRLHSITSGCFYIYSGHAYGLTIEGNTFDDGSGYLIVYNDTAFNPLITGNVFQGVRNAESFIRFKAGAEYANISNNVFVADTDYWTQSDPNAQIFVPLNWILSEGACMYCVISSNTFKNSMGSIMQLANMKHCAITGNVMFQPAATGSTALGFSALMCAGEWRKSTIVGNTLGADVGTPTFISTTSGGSYTGCAVYANIP